MSSNFENLKEYIISLSKSENFIDAKKEWKLIGIELSDEQEQCPCGQHIREVCYIENQINGNSTHVGNVCINQFIGIPTGNLFDGLKKIAKDIDSNANEDLIVHAYELGYIFENEYHFLMDTKNKRKLSVKQLAWKNKINRRILQKTVVSQRS